MKLKYWLGMLFVLPSLCLAKQRVAIIGAGPSGIAAAERLLRDPDTEVKVFGKDARIGGKVYTLPASNGLGVVELGAIQIGPGYETVMSYARELNEPMRDYWDPRSLRYRDNERDEALDKARDNTSAPWIQSLGSEYTPWSKTGAMATEIKIMDQALKRFESIMQFHLTQIPQDSEFNQSFEAWADQLQIPLFKEMFRLWMTSDGYGKLSEIPAFLPLYAIHSSTGQVLLLRLGLNLRMFSKGYSSLLNKMIEHYNIPVETAAHLTHVSRSNSPKNGIVVSYTKLGNSYVEKFDYLVVACGFVCIQEFMDDVTPLEKQLLNELYVTPYDVAIADVPGLPKGGYVLPQNLNGDTLGHVGLISKNSAGSEDAILYIPSGTLRKAIDPVPPRTRRDESNLKASIIADMARFGFQDTQVKIVHHWDNYFPHFLNPNGYRMLNEIQGKNGTIYVGGMARFEYVDTAMKHAIDMVEEHIFKVASQQSETTWHGLSRVWRWYWGVDRKDSTRRYVSDTQVDDDSRDSSADGSQSVAPSIGWTWD